MRKFRCPLCVAVSTLYDWNTNERAFRDLTLHEVKDYDDFDEVRKMVLFTCPSCKKKSTASVIKEVLT